MTARDTTAGPSAPALAAALGVAAVAYLAGLGRPVIPSIGDEPLYLQIARVTAASGRWLPLTAEGGILDTKPPLLFWTGMVATGFGRAFEPWRLRLPMVLLTFAAAGAAGHVATRLRGERRDGLLAALLFLGFRATLQHGRPFLTNPGEVLFLLGPLLLALPRARLGARATLLAGLSLGVATLWKSFAVAVPGALALLLFLWRRDGGGWAPLRRHLPAAVAAGAVGLACFLLWPALDPRPDLVWSQFVLGENAAKVEGGRFLPGLVSGRYPLWRIWLGPLWNAGLLAPPLLALAVDGWRRRHELVPAEAALWWWVLAFLLVYSLPTQRQENYLLPVMPVLAALLAARWEALRGPWIRLPLALLAGASLAVAALAAPVAEATGAGEAALPVTALAGALGLAALWGTLRDRAARLLLPALSAAALLVATAALHPFGATFPEAGLAAARGAEVAAPDRFGRAQELLRFQLPGARMVPYPCPREPALPCRPPASAALALMELDVGEAPAGLEVVAEVPRLKQRHSPAEVAAFLGGDLSLLAGRLALVRPAPAPRPVAGISASP